MLDPKDGGIASRKLWFCVAAGATIVLCWFVTGWSATLRPTLDTAVGGVLAIAGLYLTGNLSSRWISTKGAASESFQGEVTASTATTTTTPNKPPVTTTTVKKLVVDKKDDVIPGEGQGE